MGPKEVILKRSEIKECAKNFVGYQLENQMLNFAMTANLNDGMTQVMPNKKKYPDRKLQEVINIYDPKIKMLKQLQSRRSQKYIVIVTDDREHLDFSLGEHGDYVVDVLSVPNMKITNVISTVTKHPKYGKGTLFVFSGGTRDLLESAYLSDCLKAGCEFPVSILTLPVNFFDVHYLIRKSLNLHFDILYSTHDDIVLFCGLLPVSSKHYNDHNIGRRACESMHSVSQIPFVRERNYRKALRLFNDFTKYHAQTLGYEPWDLEINYYTNRSEAIFLPDGYHLNFREDNRRANRVKLLCEGIFPDAFSPKVPIEESYHCKLFIRLRAVTPERGKSYFEQFGKIVESHFEESEKHADRAFGTVTFSEASMANNVMRHKCHKIDGMSVKVKRYRPPRHRAPIFFLNEPKNKSEKIPLLERGHPERDLQNEDKIEAMECFSSVTVPRTKSVKYIDVKLQRIGLKFQTQFDEIMKLQEKRVQNNIVIFTDERDDFDVNLVGVDVMKVPFLKFGLMALSEIKRHPKFGTGTLFVFSIGVHDLLHTSYLVECLNNNCGLPQNILTLPLYNGDYYYLIRKALQLHLDILSITQNDTALFCGIIPASVDSYNEYAVGSRPCISNHTARHVQKGNFYRYKNYIETIKLYNHFIKNHAETLGYQPWNIEQSYFKSSREFNVLKIDCYNITKVGNFERSNRIKELCTEILITKSTRSTMLDTSQILKGGAPATSKHCQIGSPTRELYDEPIIYLNYERVVIITDSRYLPFLQCLKKDGVHLLVEENIEIENLKDFLWRKRKSLTARTLYLFVVGIHSVAKTGPLSVCQSLDCVAPLESLESWDDSELTKFTPEYAKKLKHLFKISNSFIPRHSNIAVLPPVPVSLICESLPHEDIHVNKSRFPNYKILQRMSMINRLYPEWVHKFTLTAISSIIACTCVERSFFNKLNADNVKLEVMDCNDNDSPLYCVWKEVVNEVVGVALKNSGSETCDEVPVLSKQRRCRDVKGPDTLNRSLKIDPQTSICEVENVSGTRGDKVSDPVLNFGKSLKNLNFNDSDKRYFNDSVARIFEEFASLFNKSKEGIINDFENELTVPKNPPESESTRKSDKINDVYLSTSSLHAENNLNKVIHIANKEDCEANTVAEKERAHRPQRKVVFIGSAASLELLPNVDFCSVSKWYDGDIARKEKLSVKVDKLNRNCWKEITFVFISDVRMLGCHEKTSTCLLRKCKRPFTQIKATEFCRSDKYDKINVIKFIIENAIKDIRKLCRFLPKFIIAPFTPFINVQISSEFSNLSVHSEMHDYVACLNNVCLVPRSNQPHWKELLMSFAKEWNEFSIKETNEDPVVKKHIKSFLSENGNPVAWKEFSSKEHNFSESGLLIRWKACIRRVVKQSCKESSKQLIHNKFLSNETALNRKRIEDVEVGKGPKNSGSTLQNIPKPISPKITKTNSTTNSSAKKLMKNDSINFVPSQSVKKELFIDSLIPLSVSDNLAQTALASSQYKDYDFHILNPVVKVETVNKVLFEPVTTAAGSHHNMVVGDSDSSLQGTNIDMKGVKTDFILPNVIYHSLENKGEDFSKLEIKISENMYQNATSTTLNGEKNEIIFNQNNCLNSEGVTQNASIEIKEEKMDFEPFCENVKSDSLFQALNCSSIKDEEFLNLESPLPILQADNSKETIQISSDIKAEPSDVSVSLPEGGIGAINFPNLSNYLEANFDIDHLVVIGNSAAKEFLDYINFFSTSHWKFDNLDKLFNKIIDLNFKSVLFVIFCDISMTPASTKTNSTITNVQNIISTIYQHCCIKRKVIVAPFNTEVACKEIIDSKLDKIWELSVLSFSKEWKKLIYQAQILEILFLNNSLTSEFFPINWNNLSSLDSSNKEADALVTPFNPGSSVSKWQQPSSLTQTKHENTKRCGISSKYLGDTPGENVSMARNIPSMTPPGQDVYRNNHKRSRSKSPDSFSFKKFKTAGPISSYSFGGSIEQEFTLPCSDFTPAFRDKIGLELFEKFNLRLKAMKQTFEEKFRIYKMMPEKYPHYEKYYEEFYKEVKENRNEQQKEYLWKTFWEINFEAIKKDDWQIEFLSLKREFEDFVNKCTPPPADPNCQVVNYPPQSFLHSPASLQSPISLPYNPISLLPHSVSFHSFISYLPPSPPFSLPPSSPSLPPPSLPTFSLSLPSLPPPSLLAYLNRDAEIPSKQREDLSKVLQIILPLLEKISDKMLFYGPCVKTILKMHQDLGPVAFVLEKNRKILNRMTENMKEHLHQNSVYDRLYWLDEDSRTLYEKAVEWIPKLLLKSE